MGSLNARLGAAGLGGFAGDLGGTEHPQLEGAEASLLPCCSSQSLYSCLVALGKVSPAPSPQVLQDGGSGLEQLQGTPAECQGAERWIWGPPCA